MQGTGCCCSADAHARARLARPRTLGIIARILVSLGFFIGAWLALGSGGLWLVFALALAGFGALLLAAAILREPGCEVNLIGARLLRKTPIDCFLFGPIDRWEERGRRPPLEGGAK